MSVAGKGGGGVVPTPFIQEEKEDVADRLRAVRLKLGMRQKDLADKLGVSESVVTLWENRKNRRPVPAIYLEKLADILGIPVADLLDGRPTPLTMKLSSVLLNLAERELIEQFRSLPEKVQLLQLAQLIECARLCREQEALGHRPDPGPAAV